MIRPEYAPASEETMVAMPNPSGDRPAGVRLLAPIRVRE